MIREGYSRRVQEKKENSINIYTYPESNWASVERYFFVNFLTNTLVPLPLETTNVGAVSGNFTMWLFWGRYSMPLPWAITTCRRKLGAKFISQNSPIVQFDTRPTRPSLTRIPKMSNKNAGISLKAWPVVAGFKKKKKNLRKEKRKGKKTRRYRHCNDPSQ